MSKISMSAGINIEMFEADSTERTENERPVLLGYYDYTVILTYAGMLAAFAGILLSINESFRGAVICLMITGLCDMFDGTVASTKQRSKNQNALEYR